MPRLHPLTGLAVSGVGGGIVSIGDVTGGGVPVHAGGAACWRDEHRIVFGGPWEGRWALLEYDRRTGQTTLLEDRPVVRVAGGGGHYLAKDSTGVFSGSIAIPAGYSDFSPTDTDGRGAASPDGLFAISDGTGQGFALLSAAGVTDRLFPGIPAYNVTAIERGRALMPVDGRLSAYNVTVPEHVGTARRACWCVVAGEVWLVHDLEGRGLVLRQAYGTKGKVIEAAPIYFCYDAIAWNGGVRIAYSTTNGEGPEQLVVRDVDVTSDLIDFGGTVTPPPPPTEDLMIPAFSHYGWVAPFFSHGKYGDTDDHVGNAIILVEHEGNPSGLRADLDRLHGRILIVHGDGPTSISDVDANTIVAWWTAGADPDALGAAVARASARQERRILAYLDSRDWPAAKPSWVTDRVSPCIQAYRRPGESLSAFEQSMRAVFERVAAYGRPMGIVPRFDDFNGSGSVAATLECMPLYERWVREFGLVDFLPFADRRGNGMATVPELRAWGRAFFYAFPERPNRFNYWIPASADKKARIRNILGQSRLAKVFEPDLEAYIRELVDKDTGGGGGPVEPPPPDTPPDVRELAAFIERRWRERGIPEQTAVIAAKYPYQGDDPNSEFNKQQDERAEPEMRALQAGGFHQIIGEWYWGRPSDTVKVLLVPKPLGANFNGLAEDTFVIGVPNQWLWFADAVISCGHRTARPGMGELQKSSEPNRWAIPPRP